MMINYSNFFSGTNTDEFDFYNSSLTYSISNCNNLSMGFKYFQGHKIIYLSIAKNLGFNIEGILRRQFSIKHPFGQMIDPFPL